MKTYRWRWFKKRQPRTSMQHSNSSTHPLSYPTLQVTDRSFSKATYQHDCKISECCASVYVFHKLTKAKFIQTQIDVGRAMYGCIGISVHTGCRKLFLSSKSNQTFEWDRFTQGELTEIRPVVVGVKDFNHIFTVADEVDDTWIGKSIYFPKGARLVSVVTAHSLSANDVSFAGSGARTGQVKKHPFVEFDSAHLATMRNALIKKNTTDKQIEFIREFCVKGSFEKWVQRTLLKDFKNLDASEVLQEKLSESEFTNMSRAVERQVGVTWKSLTLNVASNSSFWGVVTTNHILNGVIEPSYLAAEPTNRISGLQRIEDAMAGGDKEEVDKVTRTILRRFCGLGEARGPLRSIRSNCSFARAWWREMMIDETVRLTGADEVAVAHTLHKSQEFWEKVANLLMLTGASFGDEKVRVAFICALSKYENSDRYKKLFLSKGLIDRCREKLCMHSVSQEFGVYEIDDLVEYMINEIVETEV